jgi:hypothetical protein
MITETASDVLTKLTACITCAQCDERMQYDSTQDIEGERRKGYWCCPNLHLAEPDEEIYSQVVEIVEGIGEPLFAMPFGILGIPPSEMIERMSAADWPASVQYAHAIPEVSS